MKLERINTILYHIRKLGRESLTAAAANLTRDEYTELQQGLKLLDCGALEKAEKKTKRHQQKSVLPC